MTQADASPRAGDRSEAAARQAYFDEGGRRAMALGNRGPLRLTDDGRLHPQIAEAYAACGFYVFEGVLGPEELADIAADVRDLLERLPVAPDAALDARGRPALGVGCASQVLHWSKPLGDPYGGTELFNGRHPVKMSEPEPAAGAPDQAVFLVSGALQFSEAHLRLCGHPQLLAVAAAINGPDFTPFSEGIFLKAPGLGASIAWHQDGVTHWDSPDWNADAHGFNVMAQPFGCTPANGLWVLPGSHRQGRIDIRALAAEAGSDRLEGAVPIVCAPGDVAITNRQALHGSFANTSDDWRVTLNFGFLPRRFVLGARQPSAPEKVYDAERIRDRARLIGYAIDARRKRFPQERAFVYRPHAEAGETWRWDDEARAGLKDYNLTDMRI
jgi:hypothetical protein